MLEQANHLDTQFGAYIDQVIPGGPADAAGLKGSSGSTTLDGVSVPTGGDVIVPIDGVPVNSFEDLLVNIDFRNPGDSVKVTFLRNGKQQTVDLTLGVRSNGASQ